MPELEQELREGLRRELAVLAHEEVARWKSAHDAELARRKQWTLAAVLLGALGGLGSGYLTLKQVATTAVENSTEPYFAILAEMVARTRAAVEDVEKDVEAASAAGDAANAEAERARAIVDGVLATASVESLQDVVSTVLAADRSLVRYETGLSLQRPGVGYLGFDSNSVELAGNKNEVRGRGDRGAAFEIRLVPAINR